MRVIIVGKDKELLEPLIDKLTFEGFEAVWIKNSDGVRSYMKKAGINFLVADSALLVDRGLGREVHKHWPLARLVGLSANPSRLGLVEALSEGLIDYFPRTPEYYDHVVDLIVSERSRIRRWQRELMSDSFVAEPLDGDRQEALDDEDSGSEDIFGESDGIS